MATPTDIRVACFANSRMPGGRCIAGRVLEADGVAGHWVRLVGNGKGEGVPLKFSRYPDGSTLKVLDVIEVPVVGPVPDGHQQGNWLIDQSRRWTKVGSIELADLPRWTENVDSLWINGCSTGAGRNDRVRASDASSLENSLRLIKVNLAIRVFDHQDRRRTQARFNYNGTDYAIWITDPCYEEEYKQRSDGIHRLGECCITISLGGVFKDGCNHKLVAAIMQLP